MKNILSELAIVCFFAAAVFACFMGMAVTPDRLVLLPGGRIAFIELKAPGKTLRPLQVRRKRQLEALGFSVYCIDSPEQIGGILSEIIGQVRLVRQEFHEICE